MTRARKGAACGQQRIAELGDQRDPRTAFFRIKSVGRLSVKHIGVACIMSEGKYSFNISNVSAETDNDEPALGPTPIDKLAPNESATRDCATNPIKLGKRFIPPIYIPIKDLNALKLEITAEFNWPLIGKHELISRHFSTCHSNDGKTFFLVPEPEH